MIIMDFHFNVMQCRVLDPHAQLTSRRRTASVNSRDHHLGSLAEDPAEEDQIRDTDSETANSGESVPSLVIGITISVVIIFSITTVICMLSRTKF
jgi:hypothetical protein